MRAGCGLVHPHLHADLIIRGDTLTALLINWLLLGIGVLTPPSAMPVKVTLSRVACITLPPALTEDQSYDPILWKVGPRHALSHRMYCSVFDGMPLRPILFVRSARDTFPTLGRTFAVPQGVPMYVRAHVPVWYVHLAIP
jgi:hypothetical protein